MSAPAVLDGDLRGFELHDRARTLGLCILQRLGQFDVVLGDHLGLVLDSA
jgi:hypothetical protein